MKFRKKSVVVEAFRWTIDEVPDWWKEASKSFLVYPLTGAVRITTLEGDMIALPGNYIVKGVKGEMYPVRENIFEAIYEKVEE